MKLSLKVTERDKRLLVLLAIVLLLAACWQFLLKDTLLSFISLRDQVLRLEQEAEEAQLYEPNLALRQEWRAELEAEVEAMLASYYPALPSDYYIDVVVREAGSEVPITAINVNGSEQLALGFAPAAAIGPQGELGEAALDYQLLLDPEAEVPTTSAEPEMAVTAPLISTEILFAFSGSNHTALSAFLQRLENLPQKILVRNLSATARDGALSGTFTLVFPGIPALDGDTSSYVTPANPGLGRTDAFGY